MLMRQSSARCFGQMFSGVSAQSNQISITKFVGLASSATQSTQHSVPSSGQSNNMLVAGSQNHQLQRWITTFQRQQPNQQIDVVGSRAMSGNHVKIWSAEKAVSLAMVPAVILPFVWTTPLTDAIFCTLG